MGQDSSLEVITVMFIVSFRFVFGFLEDDYPMWTPNNPNFSLHIRPKPFYIYIHNPTSL